MLEIINNEFLQDIITKIIASIPELVLVLSTVLSALKVVKKNTALFPQELVSTKNVLTKAFQENKQDISNYLQDVAINLIDKVETSVETLKTEAESTLNNIQNKISGFEEGLIREREQVNFLVKENKVLMDSLIEMLAKDPTKIKSGVSQVVTNKLNLTKAELEKYPEQLSGGDLNLLEKALVEFEKVGGDKNLEKLLGKLGYEKKKNYKIRSIVYKGAGTTTVTATTLGGFFAYEISTDWANFKQELDNFLVVNEQTLKLNLAIAFPILISIIVLLFVLLKKNRSYFRDKISLGLLTTILVFYLIYSIIEVAMASLIGAFIGSVTDDFIFSPLSKSAKEKSKEQREIDIEVEKERKRLVARKEYLDGSV